MICKKVARSKDRAGKPAGIRALVDYLRAPSSEKVLYANARGFLCESHAGQREEMVALAGVAVRSKAPVSHYILSWREGEQPTPAQIEEAVSMFLDELRVREHQVIYAMHQDTDNRHLHIALNRVHPATEKIVEINRGFDIEAAHKAIARIENSQGWRRETRGRYAVFEGGEIVRTSAQQARQPAQARRDMETRTGEQSAQRIAIVEAAPLIKGARSWADLHAALGAVGLRFERKGSGAVLVVGAVAVKASAADRGASLGALERRLGPFQPAASTPALAVAPRSAKALDRFAGVGWTAYNRERTRRQQARNAARNALRDAHRAERAQLSAAQRVARSEVFRTRWGAGTGLALNALRSAVAAQHARARAAVIERHRAQRRDLALRFPPIESFEVWQRRRGRVDLAEAWRYRAQSALIVGLGDVEARPAADIRDFVGEMAGAVVVYRRALRNPFEVAARGGAFVDHGRRIEVAAWREQAVVLAALQLASAKWGRVVVCGKPEFVALCCALAARHGIAIANPNLQQTIARERAAMIAEERGLVARDRAAVRAVEAEEPDPGPAPEDDGPSP